jgi:hypothetical protein
MERVLIVNRKGQNLSFIGAGSYHVKARWLGGVTVYANGVPVGYFWRPISVSVGVASPEEIMKFRESKEAHEAAELGIKL